jgi:hypothetical protein
MGCRILAQSDHKKYPIGLPEPSSEEKTICRIEVSSNHMSASTEILLESNSDFRISVGHPYVIDRKIVLPQGLPKFKKGPLG